MKAILLVKVLLVYFSSPLIAQVSGCPLAKDSIWSDKRSPFKNYKNKTTLIFETGFSDTISVIIDGKLIVKRYMKTDPSGGAVIGTTIVTRPRVGKVVMKANDSTCTEFVLKQGYSYAYISRDQSGKWFVTYSNYERAYY